MYYYSTMRLIPIYRWVDLGNVVSVQPNAAYRNDFVKGIENVCSGGGVFDPGTSGAAVRRDNYQTEVISRGGRVGTPFP